jgi:hypothetical protein
MPLGQRFGGARLVSSGENVARRAGSNEHQVIATEPEQAESRQSHERPSGVTPGRPLPFSRATLTHLANRLAPESRDGADAMARNRYTDKPPYPVKEIP